MRPSHTEDNDWRQVSIRLVVPANGEAMVANVLGPRMHAAIKAGVIAQFWFVRKRHSWRLRYLPASTATAEEARCCLNATTTALTEAAYVANSVDQIYEPEDTAFGGPDAMKIAHDLFSADTAHLIRYLDESLPQAANDHRREISLLALSTLMRSAGSEWFEQGDTWAILARWRGTTTGIPDQLSAEGRMVRDFLASDANTTLAKMSPTVETVATTWLEAFGHAGSQLRVLFDQGRLRRGLRAIVAHHILFHWNRLGLPVTTQRTMATAARDAIFTLPAPGHATTASSFDVTGASHV